MEEKFDFRNLYHPPEKEYIHNSLSYGLIPNSADIEIYHVEYSLISGFSSLENIGRKSGKLLRWFIYLAQKNKMLIKRVPILRALALRVKRRLVTRR